MDNDNPQSRKYVKYCFVPECTNNDKKNSNVVFVKIRNDLKENWCRIVGRACSKRPLYCCENHLNLEEDVENYMFRESMGGRLTLKTTAKLRNISMEATSDEDSIANNNSIKCETNVDIKEEPISDNESYPPECLPVKVYIKEETDLHYEINASQITPLSQIDVKEEPISNSTVRRFTNESVELGNYVATVLGKLPDYNSFLIAKQNITSILVAAENGNYKNVVQSSTNGILKRRLNSCKS